MSQTFTWSDFFQLLSAVGTIALAILAIYGHKIRSWLLRPVLNVSLKNEHPYIELIKRVNANESSTLGCFQEMRVKIVNSGNETARNCKVIVDSIYLQRKSTNEFYKDKEFVPTELFWTNEKRTQDVLPKIPTYIIVAKIDEKTTVGSQTSSISNGDPSYSLYVWAEAYATKGIFHSIDKGNIVFPIVIYADNISIPLKYFVEVFWDGNNPGNIDKSNFDIKLLTVGEAKKLLGRAI